MQQQEFAAAGLSSLVVGSCRDARAIVVILHGYAMRPEALEPFAHSIRSPALFCFPQAPHAVENAGYAWWPIDQERRARQIAVGPRDLANESPSDRPVRRAQLREFLVCLQQHNPTAPLILGGFSQGGMMACDAVLCGAQPVAGLALFSASRIAIDEWSARRQLLRDLPVLISHGQKDQDLAFAAGVALRDFHAASGAKVTWQPFDGGHEIPLLVWRALRKFLKQLVP
jgi:phospholipase/carboxylesterase